MGPSGAAASSPGLAGGADATVLQLGRGPPDHRHRDLWPGPAGPRTLLQAGRSQLGTQRRLRGQPRHTGTGKLMVEVNIII